MSQIDNYRSFLLNLWPQGRAWNREFESLLYLITEGLSVEFTRLETRALELLRELDPRTTFELLSEWESMLGIPDECQSVSGTNEERLRAILLKLTQRGGNALSKQAMIDLAASVGYTVEIEEPGANLFRCGVSRCGDRLYGSLWKFWFQVITESYVTSQFRAGTNRAGDRLRSFQNTELECVIGRAKPAHTNAQFIYLGEVISTEGGEDLLTESGDTLRV